MLKASATTITDDLTCARCGYALRTLQSDSNCPECGHPVALSLAAIPLRQWLPPYRRGVTFFGLAILALILGSDWLVRNWFRIVPNFWNFDRFAAIHLLTALMLFPAAWLMSTSASFFPRNPVRLRKWLIALTATQVIFVALRLYLFTISSPLHLFWRNVVSVTVISVLPLAFDVHLWLLLILLTRPLPILPNPLPRAVLRVVQVLLIYTLLVPDLFFVVSNFLMLAHLDHPIPPGGSYFPTSWTKPLGIFLFPSEKLRPVIWWILLLVIFHFRYRLQSRLGLWPQTKQVDFESAL